MAWIKWENFLAPMEYGGLGFGNLHSFKLALIQKRHWCLVNQPNQLWVKLIKSIHGLEVGFDENGYYMQGLWADIVGSSNYLHSHNLIPKDVLKCNIELNEDCLLSDRLINGNWSWHWRKPISSGRTESMLDSLLYEFQIITLSSSPDRWTWSIDSDGSFTVEDDIHKFSKIRLDAHGIDKENSIAGSNTVKKHGLESELPWDIYYYAQQALALMKRLKTNKNDEDAKRDLRRVEGKIRMSTRYHKMNGDLPSDWKYNPATASALVIKECKPFQAKTKKIKEGPSTRIFPPVYDVPLDKEDQETWMKFKKLDEAITACDFISYPIQEKDVTTVKKDDIINNFISDFAIDAFNKCCQMVNKNEDNYLKKAEIRRCKYHKLTTMYVFYMTILAIEQGILGIYETKVECGFHDGSRTLCMFVLTDRKPTDGSSSDLEDYHTSGMVRRNTKGGSSSDLEDYHISGP
ncbi:40S ribosomal protein S13 [Tanacetum coccineum]